MSSIPGSQDPRGGCTYVRRSSRLEGEGGGVTIIAIMPQASGHGARPVPVSEWMHLYSISSCTIQPSFLSLVFNHTTSAFDPVLHLRVRAIKLSSFLFLVSLEDVKSLDPFWLSFSTNPLCGYGTQRDLQEPLFTYARNVTANANHKPATLLLYHDLRVTTN